MCIKLTNDEFLKRLHDNNIPYVPLEEYNGLNTKIDFLCPKNHVFSIRPRAIFDGQGCPYCSGNKVLKGFNDLATTHPNLAKLLKDRNDGYTHSYGSHKNAIWVCPHCKDEICDTFKNVSTRGLRCKSCSNGVSYPEKFLMSMLDQLRIKYIHDKATPWSCGKRYDFYIQEHDLIIETHGAQHYKTISGGVFKDADFQRENDFFKKELALANGIVHYIELDCRYSEEEYIKQSILQSELCNIFDLSLINWDKCDVNSYNSYFDDVLSLWNGGTKNSVDIADVLNIDRHTVLKYLKNAAKHGLCDYDPAKERKLANEKMRAINRKRVICVETGQVFESVRDALSLVNCAHQSLSSCCRGERKTCGGYHWEYYDNYIDSQ